MAKTKQTKKKTKKEKPLQVMDGLSVSFEDAMKVLSQPQPKPDNNAIENKKR